MRKRKIMNKNKKGWIKMIEAFIAILFLIGVLSVVIQSERFQNNDYSVVEERAVKILRGIQLNDSLRAEVISVGDAIESEDDGFPIGVWTFLDNNNLKLGECFLKICPADDDCTWSDDIDNEVYSKDILITATKDTYDPKKVKVFCYADY